MPQRDFPWRTFLILALLSLIFYAVCMRYPQGPRAINSTRVAHRKDARRPGSRADRD